MKKLYALFLMLIIAAGVSAQSLERFVIASSGQYAPVGTITISYTVGEMAAVESFINNSFMHLTQGFQQPDPKFVGIEEQVKMDGNFGLFPNPATTSVAIRYTGICDNKLKIRMFNVLGQLMKEAEFFPQVGQTDYILDLDGVAQGLYLIELCGKRSGQEFREETKLNVVN